MKKLILIFLFVMVSNSFGAIQHGNTGVGGSVYNSATEMQWVKITTGATAGTLDSIVWYTDNGSGGGNDSPPILSNVSSLPFANKTARSIIFLSSRTLPIQALSRRIRFAEDLMLVIFFPNSVLKICR